MEREPMIWRGSQDADKEPMHIQKVNMDVHTYILQRNLETNNYKSCNNAPGLKHQSFA